MNVALTIVALLVAVHAVGGFLIWRYQERIVFQPPRTSPSPAVGDPARLAFRARDGTPLFAYVVGTGHPDRPPILAFHGNAVVARWLIPWAREAAERLGTCVVLPEYRGYDGLGGVPSYVGTSADALAAVEAAGIHLNVDASAFVLFGHSLGTAVATELADARGAHALVLEAPFTSARDMAARWPIVGLRSAWALISRVHYDTEARVRQLDMPVHVAHGERDAVVPARMGREVFAAARNPGFLLMVRAAAHNDVSEIAGDAYWQWLASAIEAP